MRDLKTLINTMLLFIPEEEFKNTIRKLKTIVSSVEFAAPEMQTYWFNETAKVLNELPKLCNNKSAWLKVVYSIFTEQEYKDLID